MPRRKRHCIRETMHPSGKLRCAQYAAGSVVGGYSGYSRHGSAANVQNSWQAFLRQFAAAHPQLAHNRAALAQAASGPYRAMMARRGR